MTKSNKELRKFGITMAIAFAVIAGILWWREKEVWQTLAIIAGVFLVGGLIFPKLLFPIEWAWMKLAHYLGVVMTYVLVTLTFYLAITPMGLLIRLFGKDLLSRRFDRQAKSYWIPIEPDGPHSRSDKPY